MIVYSKLAPWCQPGAAWFDDAEREFDYTAGAEQALETASQQNWTVVSIKNDWNTVFTHAT